VLAATIALMLAAPGALAASFTYEGRLDDLGQPANGRYDLKLSAFGHADQGATLAAPITFEGVEVKEGRFRLDVELPLVQTDQVWLEVAVRGSGEPAFSVIPGRSKAIAAPLIGACWSSTGDSGVNPATNFIGTTDAQPFVVRTQNVQSLRIEPSAILFAGNPITTNTIAGSSANGVTAGVRGATIAGGGVPAGASDPDFGLENPNRVTDHFGTVGGGFGNDAGDGAGTTLDRSFATVGGGFDNTASGRFSTVGGGDNNTTSGAASTVGGGDSNTANGSGSAVGGGDSNTANGSSSTVGGGRVNNASGTSSTVGGGDTNIASGRSSIVGGGAENTASSDRSTVGGGELNTASSDGSTVGGGFGNTASGDRSTVIGGQNNTASAFASTVGGGNQNCAGGSYSLAVGRLAKVRPATDPGGSGSCSGLTYPGGAGDQGTFVWADSQAASFVSTGNNQFLVRAAGGFGFNTNAIPGGRLINTSTGAFLSSGGIWTNNSSRALKTAFESIDADDVLTRLLALPLTRWQYRASPDEGVHLGPVAEEFHAAFGLGADGQAISTVDANGVALAAIQGLNSKLESENAALRAEIDRRDAEYRTRLERLEAMLVERVAGER
jgi:hypothetical protein